MSKIDFYPCEKKQDCRFYGPWTAAWNDTSAAIFPTSKGRKKTENFGNADYTYSVIWCLSCKYFEKRNNFLKDRDNE